MRRPAGSIHPHNGFDINDVKLLNEKAVIQLTSGIKEPMIIQVMAAVQMTEVKLTDRFEVAQLNLQPENNFVHATLNPGARFGSGSEFEIISVHLDSSARLTELIFRVIHR
jgi:hypothetical protein